MDRKDATKPPFNRRKDDERHAENVAWLRRLELKQDGFDIRLGKVEGEQKTMHGEQKTMHETLDVIKADTTELLVATKIARRLLVWLFATVPTCVLAYFSWRAAR